MFTCVCVPMLLLLGGASAAKLTPEKLKTPKVTRAANATPEVLVNDMKLISGSRSDSAVLAAIEKLTRSVDRMAAQSEWNARIQRVFLTESFEKLTEEVRQSGRCRAPWNNYQGLCLMIFTKGAKWQEARNDCKQRGGDLVWMENVNEHEIINSYVVKKYGSKKYYHVGLFRAKTGAPLIWTGDSTSQYRGSPFKNPKRINFSASPTRKEIEGDLPNIRAIYVCRR